ncbi:MAG TPA: MotA/TolQ/ExbB proton channel family protein [Candidatus Methanoperedens sp.]|nr:MotA/TolQ/ExbB proton channel family protein [Candidatus Methanoperedens sp.]
MLEIFAKGGPVMWPLLLCSIVALAVALERAWFLYRARMNTREFMERINEALATNQLAEANRICEEYRGPLASIFQAALRKHRRSRDEMEKAIESSAGVEVAKMERNLVILATMGKMAPLLGFYGTVTGMITAFESIAKAGMGDPGVVAGGIAEALITTAAGLTIAIPTVTVQYFFVHRINRFVLDMEESSIKFLDSLTGLEEQMAQRASQRDMIGGDYLEI